MHFSVFKVLFLDLNVNYIFKWFSFVNTKMSIDKTTCNKISSYQFKSLPLSIAIFFKDIFDNIRRYLTYSIVIILLITILLIVTYVSSQRVVLTNIQNRLSKVRIAHCMVGAPRTLYREEVYAAYRRQALDILPGDLFVVLQLMNKTENIHGTLITSHGPDKYITALKYLSPRKVEWIPADDHLGAQEDRSGYGKWQRCLQHIEEAEKQNELKYDYIVRSRPDLYFAKDLPTSDLLPNDRILINPYYECLNDIPPGYNQTWSNIGFLCNANNFAISDLFAIVPRALANPYMCVGYTLNLPLQVCGTSASHPECAIKAALHKANIKYEFWPFVVKIMRSAEFCRTNDFNRFNSWC